MQEKLSKTEAKYLKQIISNRCKPLSKLFLISLFSSGVFFIGCTSPGGGRLMHNPNLNIESFAKSANQDNRLFTNYQRTAHSKWNQGWPWQFDLSGVAWDNTMTATAISPRHVVMAAHYQRKAGDAVIFHDRQGKPHRYVLERVVSLREHGVMTDVAVGLLDVPLRKSIRTYPLPTANSDPVGQLALITEQKHSLYFHRVAGVQGNFLRFRFDENLPTEKAKRLIVGDSGSPSFLLNRGELILIETHTGGGAGVGPWYGSAELQEGLRKAMAELDPAYRFQTVPLR